MDIHSRLLIPSSEILNNEPQDSDGEYSPASSDDDEAGTVCVTPGLSVEQQLHEVFVAIKTHGTQFENFNNNIKQCLTEINTALAAPTALHALTDALANSSKLDRQRERSVRSLVEFLVKHGQGCLMRVAARYTGFTPLHAAIVQKNRSLVRWMCQAYDPDNLINDILCMPSKEDKRNCVHLAIATKKEKLASFLVSLASPKTLAAKDEHGNTCLHLASAYGALDQGQLQLIRSIIEASDAYVRSQDKGAGDFNNKFRSPYLHHLDTTPEAGTEPSARKHQEATHADQGKPPIIKIAPARKTNTLSHFAGSMNKNSNHSLGVTAPEYDKIDEGIDLGTSSDEAKSIAAATNDESLEETHPSMFNASEDIATSLKKHYLRTRGHDAVLGIIYGANDSQGPIFTEKSISFDLSGYQTLNKDAIKTHISILNFESILQYIDIPNVSRRDEINKPKVPRASARASLSQTGDGRTEVESVFRELRGKGVSTILRVTVDDREQPAHSDAAIERALKDMNVEVWDWMKVDICPALILRTAPNVTEVHLYWSGTNAVLRAWSEEEGLPMLRNLDKVVLHVLRGQGCLDSRNHIEDNIRTFRTRLTKQIARMALSQIIKQVSNLVKTSTAKTNKASEHKRNWARLKVTAKDLQEALHDEFAQKILNLSKARGSPSPGDKKMILRQASDKIDEFWSAECLLKVEDNGEIAAIEAGRSRASQAAREIVSVLVRPFYELEITFHNEGSHRGSSTCSPSEDSQKHEWITCMTDFRRLLYTAEKRFDRSMDQKLREAIEELGGPITVALIDDGIELLEVRLDESMSLTGRSFHPKAWHSGDYLPWYLSSGGHGTVMASQIHRICPRAQLCILKLEDKVNPQSKKRQITMKSAAQAIREAIRRKVHIISMSWTITPPTNESEGEAHDMQELNEAIIDATKADILMFCSASDEGAKQADTYPSKALPGKIFKIGGADAMGGLYDRVGDISSVDFILPGHLVADEELTDTATSNKVQEWSGSSVATALAAGLAALILYCAQVRIVRAPEGAERREATRHFHLLKRHDNMSRAFKNIGTSGSGNKYLAVWEIFGRKVRTWQDASFRGDPIDLVAEVAKDLCFKL